ncbi:TRAP transporter substrate-binding protein [Phreatobacter cathodiphilus]|uniref:C4-dicarboxylate ABC transporter n=1 Tax=Phreatobacter cathodiphilus TaxID=1868589 RepID=A0A2S0NDF5_9HYPH|nr:TRAP transporter substrate-binding protein [Phreatobacter cathodiphilus]AVO46214.1 C4-dicarboxylate ABC transporter [Phreatobacter cathodiphilus]
MTDTPASAPPKSDRRRFLALAGATAAATVAAPAVSNAQTVTLRFQSTWPQRDIFHEFCNDYATRVNAISGGRLRLEVLAAGAVVPAFQLQDAVHAGILDGGHGVTAYWFGKNKAYSLFGTPPAYGWDAHNFLGWMNYGGGYDLYNELLTQITRVNVVGFLTGPMPCQPLGWFKRELTQASDLRGLKYRTVGLAADLFNELGSAVTILAGGEIVPALERGLIDGAEFNNPSSDSILGFADVSKTYMLQSYHQSAEAFEVIFNKAKYDAMGAEQKAILKYAAESASSDMYWKALDRYSKDLAALRGRGVNVIKTPDAILKAQLEAWDKVVARLSAENPFFKKVIDSQRAWAQRTVGYERINTPSREMSYTHFFGGS